MSKLKIYCKDPGCLPTRYHTTDAGIDLRASENYSIGYNRPTKVYTGIHVEIPIGHVGLIFPRSSIGLKGLELANTIGVIDSDYRGQVICLFRTSEQGHVHSIKKYERVAQLIILPCRLDEPLVVDKLEDLTDTKRGAGGFGHTGKH